MIALGVAGPQVAAVNSRVHVAVGNEQVVVAVVVVIEKTRPPPQGADARAAKGRTEARVGEKSPAIIVVERVVVVREIGDEEIEIAVAIVVTGRDAHAGLLAAILAEGSRR